MPLSGNPIIDFDNEIFCYLVYRCFADRIFLKIYPKSNLKGAGL